MKRILIVFGTRPEFIKLLPIIIYLKNIKKINVYICNTGQHKDLLKPFLNFYNVKIDFNLKVLKSNQSLSELSANIFMKIDNLFNKLKPNYLIVQGDTCTSLISAISAFYNKIKIFHIEAGLRTNNIYFPWPEEINRQFISKITFHNFAPTKNAKKNLINEGFEKDKITIVGNTVIDLLFMTLNLLKKNKVIQKKLAKKYQFLNHNKFYILITVHRRENFGVKTLEIFRAINKISKDKNIHIIYCQHKNAKIQKIKKPILRNKENITFLPGLDYNEFIYIMNNVDMILSDSGGIQEEAPSLGKPLLILRDSTERPEAVKSGSAMLVKPEMENILNIFNKVYFDPNKLKKMSIKRNLYGNGNSAELICKKILDLI